MQSRGPLTERGAKAGTEGGGEGLGEEVGFEIGGVGQVVDDVDAGGGDVVELGWAVGG